MSREGARSEEERSGRLLSGSELRRTLLIVLAAILTFAGPTYTVYLMVNILQVDYIISMGLGLTLFVLGIALILYLIKNRVISE